MTTYQRFLQPEMGLSLAQYISNITAHLPVMMRRDIDLKVGRRKQRGNADDRNLAIFAHERVNFVDKVAHHFTRLFPFSMPSHEPEPLELTHDTLMCNSQCKDFALKLVSAFEEIISGIEVDEKEQFIDTGLTSHTGYLGALVRAFDEISGVMTHAHIKPPSVDLSQLGGKLSIEDAEFILEVALKRCLDPRFLVRKLKRLRKQYIEHAQVTLGNVGKRQGQSRYVSRITIQNFKQQMRESEEFMRGMVVINHETLEEFGLDEVAKRTTANPENRRIELVVRSRGDEERAIDMGFEGVFITWTLPSKYHRNSHKWNGCTVKEAHRNLMEQWKLARAHFAKAEIPWFGLRVAEPHKDGTPHLHAFLYCAAEHKENLMRICAAIARSEDSEELVTKKMRKARFQAKPCDPAKGSATGYIIKYISKNINGAHMPEGDAQESAISARAWASAWGIKQFSQSGSPSVGIWRQLRRASKLDVSIDKDLATLHDHADNSRWKAFCQHIGDACLAYEYDQNQYGESVKRVIGISWLGQIIETCSARFSIVSKSDAKAWKAERSEAKRGGAPSWSTENKCNHPLTEPLMRLTGWSSQGVQCLISPLMRGAKVQIDRYTTVSFKNNRLIVY
ncbi:replication endonuclease [Vibrio harveyi]|uniref:replication endonuclease n=1 Tax=Vibrio harveyi TaxID=669 RepID=UPI003BB49A30